MPAGELVVHAHAHPPIDAPAPIEPERAPHRRVEAVGADHQPAAPELAADIVDKGIVLTGGGALLSNLDLVLRHATGLPVSIADDPLTCVALGSGRALEEMKTLENVLINTW